MHINVNSLFSSGYSIWGIGYFWQLALYVLPDCRKVSSFMTHNSGILQLFEKDENKLQVSHFKYIGHTLQ